jgi:hypothetical protein
MVLHNLYAYVKQRYSNIIEIDDNRARATLVISLDEMLNQFHDTLFSEQACLVGDRIVFNGKLIESVDDELACRYNLIQNITQPYVLKYFPLTHRFLDNLPSFADRTYYLTRQDLMSQTLSFCLSSKNHVWCKGSNQDQFINESLEQPVHVDEALFRAMAKKFKWFNTEYIPQGSRCLDTSQIETISSAENFCKLLDLEFVDFKFIKFRKEFGDNKRNMVSNIARLEEIFMEVDAERPLPQS